MLPQDLTRALDNMHRYGSLIADSLALVEVCRDCLEKPDQDSPRKLEALLACLQSHLEMIDDDFPYRLRVLEQGVEAFASADPSEPLQALSTPIDPMSKSA